MATALERQPFDRSASHPSIAIERLFEITGRVAAVNQSSKAGQFGKL